MKTFIIMLLLQFNHYQFTVNCKFIAAEPNEAVMPTSHLACDGCTETVSCPYPPFSAAYVRRQEAAVIFSYWFTGSMASTTLFSRKLYKFEKRNRKFVACRHVVGGIAQSPHRHHAEAAHPKMARWLHCHHTISAPHRLRTISIRNLRRLHDSCTVTTPSLRHKGSVRLLCRVCGHCIATALRLHEFPYNLCTASVWICPGLLPRALSRNRTMLVDNMNAYAAAHSHLRCPQNQKKNSRQIYCTSPGASVN